MLILINIINSLIIPCNYPSNISLIPSTMICIHKFDIYDGITKILISKKNITDFIIEIDDDKVDNDKIFNNKLEEIE